jgi:hypothetical protein
MEIEANRTLGGSSYLKITDGKETFKIFAELTYERDSGHGGESYAAGIKFSVRKETKNDE